MCSTSNQDQVLLAAMKLWWDMDSCGSIVFDVRRLIYGEAPQMFEKTNECDGVRHFVELLWKVEENDLSNDYSIVG